MPSGTHPPIKKGEEEKNHVSCVMCHVSHVKFCMSPVTCHLSPSTATHIPLLLTPLCTVGWFVRTQGPKLFEKQEEKNHWNALKLCFVFQIANITDTPFDRMPPVHREAKFPGGDNIKTDRATFG